MDRVGERKPTWAAAKSRWECPEPNKEDQKRSSLQLLRLGSYLPSSIPERDGFVGTCGSLLIIGLVTARVILTGGDIIDAEVTTRQVLGRPVCDRGAIPRTLVQWNVVRSRLIILINEEINEANWMVSNSAQLDLRTKQYTQFGASASNGSRDMAWTKSLRKKQKKFKKQKITKRIGW